MNDWPHRLREFLTLRVPQFGRGMSHFEIRRDELFSEVRTKFPGMPPEEPGEAFEGIEKSLAEGFQEGEWRISYSSATGRVIFERVLSADAIQRQIELVKRQTVVRLGDLADSLDGFAFQRLVIELLRNLPWIVSVQSSKLTQDGGVDFQAQIRHDDVEFVRIVGQVKRTREPVGPGPVREFIGSFLTVHGQRPHYGIFVSFGGYSEAALDLARSSPVGIQLYTWSDLVRWMLAYKVGVRNTPIALEAVDERFWDEIRA
jgi:hypothetical protein